MPGRNAPGNYSYKYGFNGQEKDDEVYGAGNLNSAEFWEYDTRLGRRWNVDPIVKIHESPYACFSDNPIYFADPTGSNTVTPISNPEVGDVDPKTGSTYTKDGWMMPEVKTTPDTKANIEKREAELNSPVRNQYEPNAQQKVIYGAMNKFSKNTLIGAVAIPSAVVAVQSGFALWLLRTTAIVTLEELAGLPNPEGWGVKTLEKEMVKDAFTLSKKTFGHTFTTHGEDMTDFLVNRAKGSGMSQGQFLNNKVTAEFILQNVDKLKNGAMSIPMPKDFPARIINPDGSFSVPTHIRLIPGGNGVKTAYPTIE